MNFLLLVSVFMWWISIQRNFVYIHITFNIVMLFSFTKKVVSNDISSFFWEIFFMKMRIGSKKFLVICCLISSYMNICYEYIFPDFLIYIINIPFYDATSPIDLSRSFDLNRMPFSTWNLTILIYFPLASLT